MWTSIRQALELVGPRWRRRWFGLVPLGALAAALEMLGAASVFLLIRLVSDPSALQSIVGLAPLRQWTDTADGASITMCVALCVAGLFLVKNAVRLFEAFARQYCAEGAAVDLGNRLLSHYMHAPLVYHHEHNSADLIRNLQFAVRAVPVLALHAASIIASEGLIALGLVGALLWVTPWVALLVVGLVGAIGAVMLWATQHGMATAGARLHHLRGEELQALQQGLEHFKEATLFGRVQYFIDAHRRINREAMWIEVRQGTYLWLPRLGLETVFVIGLAALVITMHLTSTETWQLAPTLSVFAYAGLRLLPSFHLIINHLNRLQFSRQSVAEVHHDLQGLASRSLAVTPVLPAGERVLRKRIDFEGIDFSYRGATLPALSGIHVTIARGESIGIVGATGSGKTTFLLLLLGLLEPTAGRIRVDGRDIREHLRSWQNQIGYVPQEVSLLDTSLSENIAFAVSAERVDPLRVAQAASIAQLDDLIASLPNGLNSLVGERGTRLSGGERQRIAVARALYHDPEVLVFDEATSALDGQTERALTDTIERLHGRKTMIVVAHRLSTVRGCDRLVVLAQGRVAGVGTYEQLAATNPAFRRLLSLPDD